ncbi:MAG: hypothetical protein KGJ10_07805 [Acidobacteriota bacterium]|nr:hypothetical protein [Acidobacteriota bacterium]
MSAPNTDVAAARRHPSSLRSRPDAFAHPSEELFARLLTLYGHEWLYEPLEFPLAWDEFGRATKGFRPDFFLPAQGLFIELTVLEQRLVTKKNRKIREFRALYPEFRLVVVYQSDFLELVAKHQLPFDHHRAA